MSTPAPFPASRTKNRVLSQHGHGNQLPTQTMEEKVHVSESYHFANMHWQKSGETDGNGLQEYLATEGRAAL